MKKKLLFCLSIICLTFASNAQNVTIPDANFKAYLVGNSNINTNSDTDIQLSEAAAFAGMIDCSGLSISSLTGIEAFTALTSLNCYNNQLTSLDVSANTLLGQLWCYENDLTTLDISNNTGLYQLRCNHNQLTSLNLGTNSLLFNVVANNNSLTSLDVSQTPALIYLHCNNNQLTDLDLSANPQLAHLYCNMNLLTELELNTNSALTVVSCGGNPLTFVNIANGNNTALASNFYAYATNSNNTCIQVDDVAYSTSMWTQINTTTIFSLDCAALASTNEVNPALALYPNPASSEIHIELNTTTAITLVNLLGEQVASYNGTNGINTIDVSGLPSGVYFVQAGTTSVRFVKK